MVYRYIKNPVTTRATLNLWLEDFKHGFVACGMPSWWINFAETYLAMFIRIVGSLCVMTTRIFMPSYPVVNSFINAHTAVLGFVLIMCLLFYIYLAVFSFCNIWSSGKYLLTGRFMKFNSPALLEPTVRRGISTVIKLIGYSGVAAATNFIPAADYVQTNVFTAGPDQLLSKHMKDGVDAVRKVSGYNGKSILQ
jgi:hypothetical protein